MQNWIISPEKYLTADEVRALRKTCKDAALLARSKGNHAPVRDAVIIELALGTGLRVSEISNLGVLDLYLKKGQNLLIVRNGKGGKDRVVQFTASLKKILIKYLKYRGPNNQYVFPSERGPKMTRSGIQQIFKKVALKAGLATHYSIHSLRHTYAVRLYKASGYNLRLVQKQLGHSNISTTQIYADVVNEDAVLALENLDREED